MTIQPLTDLNGSTNSDAALIGDAAALANAPPLSPIQRFYHETCVFITGSTGFLGKILLEKLLRSCPTIANIYILVRPKKGKDVQTRVDELFDDAVFETLKQIRPKFRHCVTAVAGDCALPEMGLSMQDRQILIDEVNVVFHVAATVRFDEKLKLAVAINVRGPLDLLELAHNMKHLKSFMHVSTAYSNVPQQVIDEKFYDSPVDCRKLISLTETLPEQILDNITTTILDRWPNTYTYTKMVAEDVIRSEGCDLPVGVFRPAIVVSTYREPIRAWINNLYGPTGVCAGAGTGLLRTLHCNPQVNANIIPVDMCVNALIAAAWEVGESFCPGAQSTTAPVYNYVSSNDKPINWGEFMSMSYNYGMRTPSVKAIWYYCFTMQTTMLGYAICTFILHYVPAVMVDAALLCMGRSPKMLKIYKKIHKFTSVISYFCTHNWQFRTDNMRRLIDKMVSSDREMFFCDLKKLEWHEFFRSYLCGIRVHLIQDPMETLEEATVKWNRLYWLHQCVKALVVILIMRLCLWILTLLFFS